MRMAWSILIVLVALVGVGSHIALRGKADPVDLQRNKVPAYSTDYVAADGVIEGARPEIALRPEIPGTILAIYFRENQEVEEGSLLVELHNETQKQMVALAEAELAIAKAELERLLNGERAEKRQALAAIERTKRATYLQAQIDLERTEKLFRQKSASQEQRDTDYYKTLRAQADLEQATAERALVEAPARADDVRAAEGRVAVGQARLQLAEAELAKTRLIAPSGGCILRVYAEPGELAGPNSRQPVLLLADLSTRRVRAFVEELDASRVHVGQSAVVIVDGLADREFNGTVALVMPRMGKRSLETHEPQEYKDLYFREVLIELAPDEKLTPNLRVKTWIKVNQPR